ncbi:MAG: hypothetical protein GF411_18905 [Candidatus Lokiarchaeota archaeon]|nr:hypothetical protein [Candidatus Lokiarchaeota archaeon]
MNIHLVPFKHVNALTDINTKDIFISTKIDYLNIDDILMDECVHLSTRSGFHDEVWRKECEDTYGRIPYHNDSVDGLLPQHIGANIGNITGIQNMLLDYHLLQSYRKFSQRVLGTEGSWEATSDRKLRLKPTPKGSFPVVVRYIPSIDEFTLPSAREICIRAIIAQAKQMIGMVRRKMSLPSPDGGIMTLDGAEMVSEGREEYKECIQDAIRLGEPLGFVLK